MDDQIIGNLVAASHILANEGVLDGLGHVSMRHPDNPQRYLMSRSLAPALVTASDVLEYDLDSNAVEGRGRELFLERFIHGEAYKARPDVMAVIHSHSPTTIPFSVSRTPLQPVFNGAAFLSPSVPVFDIRNVAGMTDLLIGNAARPSARPWGKAPWHCCAATATSWSERLCSKSSIGRSKRSSMLGCSFRLRC